jgi:hypothetical protein
MDLAEAIRTALADPAVRAEIAALVLGDDERRKRRLAELQAELDQHELTWQRRDNSDGP